MRDSLGPGGLKHAASSIQGIFCFVIASSFGSQGKLAVNSIMWLLQFSMKLHKRLKR